MRRLTIPLLLASPLAQAQITLDGSLGPAGALEGLDVEIPAELGRRLGGNLFHSFGHFHVPSGGSALFTGPAGIDHVIGRVTGGEVSSIDGLLGTAFEGSAPDLWLVNPAGVVFGPNATLDVQGGLHVSTADYLRLGNGGRFAADLGQGGTLTSAPPAAFGFLGAGTGSLTVNGATLTTPEGRDLSLVGGEIEITDGTLDAPGGRLSLAAVAMGEVARGPAMLDGEDTTPGDIRMVGGNLSVYADQGGEIVIRAAALDVSGTQVIAGTGDRPGGDMAIRAEAISIRDGGLVAAGSLGAGDSGDLTVTAGTLEIRSGATLSVTNGGAGAGGALWVRVDRLLLSGDGLTGVASLGAGAQPLATGRGGDIIVVARSVEIRQGGQLYTSTQGAADAGHVRVSADEIRLSGEDHLGATVIGSQTEARDAAGRGGDITVETDLLEIRGGAQLVTISGGAGAGGDLRVTAREIRILGDGQRCCTAIIAQTRASANAGRGGDLQVSADRIVLRDGALISTSTPGAGDAGDLILNAGELSLAGVNTGVSSQTAQQDNGGRAGDMVLTVDRIVVRDGAVISTTTMGSGDGGGLRISAGEIILAGADFQRSAGIAAQTGMVGENAGRGGELIVQADYLEIRGVAQISSSSGGGGDAGDVSVTADRILVDGEGLPVLLAGITSQAGLATGDARGGDVRVSARVLELRDSGQISATSVSRGDAGDLLIRVGERLVLDDSAITAEAGQSGGGAVTIDTTGSVSLAGSTITTSVAGGDRNAGNITLTTPVTLAMVDGSEIRANAFEGAGGNVRIVTDNLLQHPSGVISASSERGVDGDINIDATEADLGSGLLALGSRFLVDPELPTPCGVYRPDTASTFALGGAGLPAAPDGFLSGDYLAIPTGANSAAGRFFLGGGCAPLAGAGGW